MSKIDDEDDLNDGLDDDEWLCGGETDPRARRGGPRYSSSYSYPYHGPWNYSQNTTVDYLVQAHKREITSLKAHHEEKLRLCKQNADLQMECVLIKLTADHEALRKENENLQHKLKRS